jgi:hypothetical protein
MAAYVLRLSGLRDMVRFRGHVLGTTNFSSLSHALSRPACLQFAQRLLESLQGTYAPGAGELVVIDSMPVTLPATLRHRCVKYNPNTVGGGILWSYALDAPRGCCPVKVHKVMAGAWGDAALMADVELVPNGPLYLMDRGFVGYGLVERWLQDGVRFILRLRDNAAYEELKELSPPRPYGTGHIERDAIVRLGSDRTEAHPVVRLISAQIETRAGWESLVLITSQNEASAERVLDDYNQRQRIEQFHRFLKETLGLAHLYNFSQPGLTFLLYAAVLLALMLFRFANRSEGDVLETLRIELEVLRLSCCLGHRWRRNMNANKGDIAARERVKQRRRRLKNH